MTEAISRRAALTAPFAITAVGLASCEPDMAFAGSMIDIGPGVRQNPHFGLMVETITEIVKDGFVRAVQDHLLAWRIEMMDPKFRLRAGRPVFNWVDGDVSEPGLELTITTGGIELPSVGISSSHGCSIECPPYFVRAPFLDYYETEGLRARLESKKLLRLDMGIFRLASRNA